MKIKRVRATTNNLTQAIINHAISQGHVAKRINNTGVWDPQRMLFRSLPKAERGKFDIYICLAPKGQSLWIDVKLKSDKPSENQLRFQQEIKKVGGRAIFIKSYDEYLEYINNI
jgi:hypothetical protein